MGSTFEDQSRNQLEAAERLGNEQQAEAARKQLLSVGVDVQAERKAERAEAAAKRAAATKPKDEAPQERTSRKEQKA